MVIKNPVGRAYVGQANFANNQQINNETASRTREMKESPTELLEKTDGERLDTGTPQEAVRSNQTLATVEVKHGSKDKKRQE